MHKKVKVEVNAVLGTFIEVDVLCDDEGYIESENLYLAVKQAIKDKYKIDDIETVLNSININNWRYK